MCDKMPVSKAAMLNVNGVGENKYAKYGERFMAIIKPYASNEDVIIETSDNTEIFVEKEPVKKSKIDEVPDEDELNGMQLRLYEYLKQVRYDLAKKENKRAYWILTNKALIDFVIKMPDTKEKMLELYGVGEQTAEVYGDIFIEATKEYLKKNGALIDDDK